MISLPFKCIADCPMLPCQPPPTRRPRGGERFEVASVGRGELQGDVWQECRVRAPRNQPAGLVPPPPAPTRRAVSLVVPLWVAGRDRPLQDPTWHPSDREAHRVILRSPAPPSHHNPVLLPPPFAPPPSPGPTPSRCHAYSPLSLSSSTLPHSIPTPTAMCTCICTGELAHVALTLHSRV